MLAQTKAFASLFSAVFILLAGHGLQLILLPMRAQALGWQADAIALTGSTYFLGFLLGCLSIPRLISAVGHIRVFSVTTTVLSAVVLLLLLTESVGCWALLRLISGWAISGAYLIVESWLNEQSDNSQRGRVLSAYTFMVLTAMCLGQAVMAFSDPLGLAVIPVSLTTRPQPAPIPQGSFSLRRVFRTSPGALVSAFVIGNATGALYALAPSYARDIGLDIAGATLFSIAIVVGGALFQWPAGRLSDTADRRWLIAALALIGVAASATASLLVAQTNLIIVMLIIGGATVSIYPLCLAHANDRNPANFLETGTGILMVNAVGSVIGPLLAALVMGFFGSAGYYYFLAGVQVALIAVISVTIARRPPVEEHTDFVAVAKTTQAQMDLDPRSD